jgi:hypothetical protein
LEHAHLGFATRLEGSFVPPVDPGDVDQIQVVGGPAVVEQVKEQVESKVKAEVGEVRPR